VGALDRWNRIRRLSASAWNRTAVRLYEDLGFVIWGTESDALRVDDSALADHHMTLHLRR
jgi:hypothetical protein